MGWHQTGSPGLVGRRVQGAYSAKRVGSVRVQPCPGVSGEVHWPYIRY